MGRTRDVDKLLRTYLSTIILIIIDNTVQGELMNILVAYNF